jgi:hypothetical protein
MLYFDSVSRLQLPPWHQLAWTTLHFPLHLALTLFTEGCAQFIIFWKTTEIEKGMLQEWNDLLLEAVDESTEDFSQPFRTWIDDYFNTKPPHYLAYRWTLNDTFDDLAAFDGPSRDTLREVVRTGDAVQINKAAEADPEIEQAIHGWAIMFFMAVNIANSELGLDYYEDELQGQGIGGAESSAVLGTLETEVDVTYRAFYRMRVVFQYTFACGGAVIGLLAILSAIGRKEKWTRWPVVRTVINLVLAVGVALVAGLTQFGNHVPLARYLLTPLVLPPLTILFFWLLVLHHLPEGPFSRCLSVKKWRKSKGGPGKEKGAGREVVEGEEERDVESASTPEGVRSGGADVSEDGQDKVLQEEHPTR